MQLNIKTLTNYVFIKNWITFKLQNQWIIKLPINLGNNI